MKAEQLWLFAAYGWSLANAIASVSPQAQSVCDDIYANAPSRLAYSPSSDKASSNSVALATLYNTTRTTYWDAANDADFPACMFFPASAQDVSSAIIALGKQPNVSFALKSGGHNWNRGFSSTNGGVLISFRPNLQNTTLMPDGQTAQVGPGSRWLETMEVLDKSNKCAVGGRDGDVGVGGYLLQGGISYLTAQHGFACDNIVEYELVTANGTILTVNNSTNSGIYWALRGGGNAFGVVTMYTLRTYDIGEVWGGERYYNVSQLSTINAAFSNFIANNFDTRAAIILNYNVVVLTEPDSVSINYFYDGSTPPDNVFTDFISIPYTSDTIQTQRYPHLLDSGSAGETSALGIRTTNAISSLPNMPTINTTSFLDWHWNQVSKSYVASSAQELDVVLVGMALQAIPIDLQRASQSQGPGALTLDPNHGDKVWIEYDMGWNHTTCDDYCPPALIQLVDQAREYQMQTYAGIKLTNYVSGDLSWVPYNPLFMNDAQNTQDILRSYGNDTYYKLKCLHESLDPEGFLTSRQKGFFFNSEM